MAKAQSAPDLHIPESKNTVTVSIIDTTAVVTVPAAMFMEPIIKGVESLKACCYSFLIKHDNPDAKTKYDTMVFDLGVRKDLDNSPKVVVDQVRGAGMDIPVEKDVIDILKDNGEDPAKVGGIIWSHWHLVRALTIL